MKGYFHWLGVHFGLSLGQPILEYAGQSPKGRLICSEGDKDRHSPIKGFGKWQLPSEMAYIHVNILTGAPKPSMGILVPSFNVLNGISDACSVAAANALQESS